METEINPIKPNRIRPEQIISLNHGYIVEICQHIQSFSTALHLRTQAYEAILPDTAANQSLIYDSYDNVDNANTFLVWKSQKAIGSIRSIAYDERYQWKSSPALEHFSQAIEKELGAHTSFIESDRLVIHPKFSWQKSIAAQLALFQMQLINATVHQSEFIITTVRREDLTIYEDFLGMRKISNGFETIELIKDKVCLMAIDIPSGIATVKKHNLPDFTEIELDRFKSLINFD